MDTGELRIGKGTDWHFVNGEWVDAGDGMLSVLPDVLRQDGSGMQGVHFAFQTALCFQDCTFHFQFSLQGHSDVGVIFRARDEANFSVLHFPNCGQACRAQHFWVALSTMDDSGYLRRVRLAMVRRVPSNKGFWLDAQVSVRGPQIVVEVGDYGTVTLHGDTHTDDTYAGPGHVGLFAFQDAKIRGVRVEGTVEPPVWSQRARQAVNWFHPIPNEEKVWQQAVDVKRFADGELLMLCNMQRNQVTSESARATPFLLSSSDRGRTWSSPWPVEIPGTGSSWSPPRIHLTPRGRLIAFTPGRDCKHLFESPDRGHTWESLGQPKLHVGPSTKQPVQQFSPQGFLNLRDGGILTFMLAGHDINRRFDLNIWTWGGCHCQGFSSRSDDDGQTWSSPVNLDSPGADELDRPFEGSLDLTEASAVQLENGRVMAFIRPIYSPWMWETWSDDGGRTWGPCVRGPFPGYAAPNMVKTSSGAFLIAHRMPMLTVHCSLDNGRTWDEGTTIDSGLWAMGSMVEVEPDVVLYLYWDSFGSLLRAQYLHVTSSGLDPVRPTP